MSSRIVSRLFVGAVLDPSPIRWHAEGDYGNIEIEPKFRERLGDILASKMEAAEQEGTGFRDTLNTYLDTIESGLCYQSIVTPSGRAAILGIKVAEADVYYDYNEGGTEPKLEVISPERFHGLTILCKHALSVLGIDEDPSLLFHPDQASD